MRNNFSSSSLKFESPACRTDIAGRLFPCQVRHSAVLDYYGESQLAERAATDFFEFIPLEPSGLITIIGHVSGQTPAAAALLAPAMLGFLRTRLRGDGGGDIRRVVRDLNRTLCDTLPDTFYAALFCAAIYPQRREMRYVNAGHEPALLARRGVERVHRLESTGTVLGLTPRAGFGQRSIALEPGDCMAAFTDGVADAADPAGNSFGAPGVLHALCGHSGARASAMAAAILDAVRQFADPAAPAGDRTVAVARLNPVLRDPLLEAGIDDPAFAVA